MTILKQMQQQTQSLWATLKANLLKTGVTVTGSRCQVRRFSDRKQVQYCAVDCWSCA